MQPHPARKLEFLNYSVIMSAAFHEADKVGSLRADSLYIVALYRIFILIHDRGFRSFPAVSGIVQEEHQVRTQKSESIFFKHTKITGYSGTSAR